MGLRPWLSRGDPGVCCERVGASGVPSCRAEDGLWRSGGAAGGPGWGLQHLHKGSWRARLTDPLGGREVAGSGPVWKGTVLVAALTDSCKLGDFRPCTVLISQL